MGETLARIVVDPIAASCKSFDETCLDSCEFDSSCSDYGNALTYFPNTGDKVERCGYFGTRKHSIFYYLISNYL